MKKIICVCLVSLSFLGCTSQNEIKTISTAELKVLLTKEKVQLLDVRTPEEIKLGAIEGAIFANYFDADFKEKSEKIIAKDKPVYIYCKSGNRSGKSCKLLKAQGFEVINVLGGYSQWEREN